jgi:hypothetical protein
MRECNLFSHEPAMVCGNDQDKKYLLGSRHLQRPTKGLKSLTPQTLTHLVALRIWLVTVAPVS